MTVNLRTNTVWHPLLMVCLCSAVFAIFNTLMLHWAAPMVIFSGAFAVNLVFWSLCCFSKYGLRLAFILTFIPTVLICFFYYVYDVSPLLNQLALISQTNMFEAFELLNNHMLALCLTILVTLIICYQFWRIQFAKSHMLPWLSVVVLIVFYHQTVTNYSPEYRRLKFSHLSVAQRVHQVFNPIGTSFLPLMNIHDSWLQIGRTFSNQHFENITHKHHFTWPNMPKNLLVILVIGEAARFDRFQINGYHKKTSPLLMQQKNLISLKNYFALETSTQFAIPYLFKRSTQRKFIDPNETGFISILNHFGFHSYYLSLQDNSNSMELNRFVQEAHYASLSLRNQYLGQNAQFYDTDLLTKAHVKLFNQPGRNLIVLHTLGSHYDYRKRTPKWFYNRTLNAYDNSIRFTDLFLHRVIQLAKPHNAIVIYSSDHGESLPSAGDKHRFHAYPYHLAIHDAPEQLHIPSFWYVSPQFNKNYPGVIRQLTNHAHQYADQSYIFHSILGCLGIQSDVLDANKNLCADNAVHAQTIQ